MTFRLQGRRRKIFRQTLAAIFSKYFGLRRINGGERDVGLRSQNIQHLADILGIVEVETGRGGISDHLGQAVSVAHQLGAIGPYLHGHERGAGQEQRRHAREHDDNRLL